MPTAYLWRTHHYCPTCIVNALTQEGRFGTWRRSHRLSDNAEADLDNIARWYGVERATASSDFFPMPVYGTPEGDPLCSMCLRWFE